MKRTSLIIALALFSFLQTWAQTRCFEFQLDLDFSATDWRDSLCVACTSDTAVINDVLSQLSLPLSSRNKMINGPIAAGNAGVNNNSTHQFKWHFTPSAWALAEMSIEVCDGRPWTDVDADTAYWLHTVGQFCPWSSRVYKEVLPSHVDPIIRGDKIFSILPNPATDAVVILPYKPLRGQARLVNAEGRIVKKLEINLQPGQKQRIDIAYLPAGIYYMQVQTPDGVLHEKLIKQ